jgi:adenylate cyclase class IV
MTKTLAGFSSLDMNPHRPRVHIFWYTVFMNYVEKEIKVLGVDVPTLVSALETLGAKKVFDDDRVFTYFDYEDYELRNSGEEVRLTEEEKIKLSYSQRLENGEKETIKLFVSRKQEAVDFLFRLGLNPVAEIHSHRISYEFGSTDFDIDVFPEIPSFLEIDLGDSPIKTLEELIDALNLKEEEKLDISTHKIYEKFGIDIFERFKI